jgi:hypothetical protein
MSARPTALVGGLLFFCVVSGCSYATSAAPFQATPGAPLHATVTTDPPARADGTVPRDARFVIQLDGYPDPDTAVYGPLSLHSGKLNFDFKISIDFLAQQIIMTPHTQLSPGAQYDVVATRLASVDGRLLAAPGLGSARAGTDLAGPPAPAPVPTWSHDIQRLLGGCAPYCHSPIGASMRMRTPTRMLDLTGDPNDPTFGLVGVPSVGLSGTLQPLLRVSPGDPARSELLRKLIGGNPSADSIDPPYPNMAVDGRRMPIPLDESQPASERLDDASLELIQDWIAGGALP